jgi:MFS family permease
MSAPHSFLALLRAPVTRRLAAGGLVARLREGGIGLAVVLAVRHAGGSYGAAGVATALYLAASAPTRPLHGRWVDRRGPGRALLVPSAINSLALLGLAAASAVHGSLPVLDALAAVTGITLPALSAALRATWPRVVAGPADRAYAFDTFLYELSLIVSPALVGLVAALVSPAAALAGLAVAGSVGTAVVCRAAPRQSQAGRSVDDHRAAARALRSPVLAGLVVAALFVGLAEGSLTVIVPAVASAAGHAPVGGVLLSALALGSLLGALAYGGALAGLRWPARLVLTSAALAAACVALAAVPAGLVGFGALLALVGVGLSPTLTTGFAALQIEAPPRALTEAFTWSSFCAAGGAAAGQALAGQLVSGPGVSAALWEPAAAAAVALSIAVALRGYGRGRTRRADRPARDGPSLQRKLSRENS